MKRHFLLSYWPRYDYINMYNDMAIMKITFYYPTGQGMTIFRGIIIWQPCIDNLLLFYWPRYDYIFNYDNLSTMDRHILSYRPR